ncbi:MAG: peptidoglycan-binding domain-containing protein [Candidatus Acidulodesulfobacterium sp.]
MKKVLLSILFLSLIAIPSSSFAAVKPVKKAVAKKVAAKKVVAKKTVKTVSSATVKAVQQALAKDGLFKGKVDGMIGPVTTNAVKAFQKKNGLKADGIIGPMTLKKLGVK